MMRQVLEKVILLLFILLLPIGLFALPIDSTKAMTVAQNFFMQKSGVTIMNLQTQSLPEVSIRQVGISELTQSPCYYIVENQSNGGWVILSADERFSPVLGYSMEGILENDTNPAFDWWMNDIIQQMEASLQEEQSTPNIEASAKWTDLLNMPTIDSLPQGMNVEPLVYATVIVPPLLTCTWNQAHRYNDSTPNQWPAGCAAVAMGQILHYWGHKNNITTLQGKGSYTYKEESCGQILSVDYSKRTYNLSSLPNSVSSNAPVPAVASLLRDLGVSVRMRYAPSGSATPGRTMVSGLACHFGFKPARYILRASISNLTTWKTMLMQEIDSLRPVIYTGADLSWVGHAFVLDGYDSDTLFHVNWGWGGSYNGYFAITSFTPSRYNFANEQRAVFGLEPYAPNEIPDYEMYNIRAVADNDSGCQLVNKYRNGTKLVIYYEIKNNTNKTTELPLIWSYHSSLPSGTASASYFMSSYPTVPANGTYSGSYTIPSSYTNIIYGFTSNNLNIDLGIQVSSNPNASLDIGRNPILLWKDTAAVMDCSLSDIIIDSIYFALDGIIAVQWKKEDSLAQDLEGNIILYNSLNQTLDTVNPASSGVFEMTFNPLLSADAQSFYVKHIATGKADKQSSIIDFLAYPQIQQLTSQLNNDTIQIDWSLYHNNSTSNYISGDKFEIECYDNVSFSGIPLWTDSVNYLSGTSFYSLEKIMSSISADTLYFRIRRTYTRDIWEWTDMVTTSKLKTTPIIKQTQTITFPALSSKQVGDANFSPEATASSGLAVNYISSNLDVATIVNDSIHIVGVGTSIITAYQNGNHQYAAADSVEQLLTVIRALNTDASLDTIIISEGSLTPKFHSDTVFYSVELPYQTDSIIIQASTRNINAKISSGIGTSSLQVGKNTSLIHVYAEDTTISKTYQIVITRKNQTNISENSPLSIKIFPNPVNDVLYVESPLYIEQILVYDIDGRQLKRIVNPVEELSISDLASGIYFIKIKTIAGEVVKKIVKN